jgi:hypothetical protein
MSSLDVFVFVIVPVAVVSVCAASVWLQDRANQKIQFHVKRLERIRALGSEVSSPQPFSPTIRGSEQLSLSLYTAATSVSAMTEIRGDSGEAGAEFMQRYAPGGFTMRTRVRGLTDSH